MIHDNAMDYFSVALRVAFRFFISWLLFFFIFITNLTVFALYYQLIWSKHDIYVCFCQTCAITPTSWRMIQQDCVYSWQVLKTRDLRLHCSTDPAGLYKNLLFLSHATSWLLSTNWALGQKHDFILWRLHIMLFLLIVVHLKNRSIFVWTFFSLWIFFWLIVNKNNLFTIKYSHFK